MIGYFTGPILFIHLLIMIYASKKLMEVIKQWYGKNNPGVYDNDC